MRVSAALLVIFQLLARCAAVPHEHEVPTGTTGHGHQAHVHFAWDSDHHAHDHHAHDHHDGDHDDHDAAFPHDCDAVYVDGSPLMGPATLSAVTEDTAFEWCSGCGGNQTVSPGACAGCFKAGRPPGDSADMLHTFLPHVLRI